MASISRAQASRVARFVVGCLLLAPACLAWGLASWYPALRVFWLSLQGVALGRAPEWMGLAHYGALLQDAAWWAALGRTLVVALVRVAAILPAALVGLVWGRARPGWRLPVRLALTLALALSAPVAMGLLWQRASERLPLLAGLALNKPGQAWPSYLALEAVSFTAVGGALTALAMLAACRRAPVRRAAPGVLALAALAALASGLDAFALPWATTGGGPAQETMTLSLYAFRTAFLRLQPGLAAAQLMPLTAAGLALGLLFGLLSERLGLRLQKQEVLPPRPFPAAGAAPVWKSPSLPRRLARAALAIPAAPALGALVLPPLLLYLYGAAEALLSGNAPLVRAASILQVGLGLVNGTLPPGLTILLVQLPASYLAALSLSLVRPFGERGSRAAFVLLLAGCFVPATATGLGLYEPVSRAGLANTHPALGAPLLAGAAGLYLFKLHFDGRRRMVEESARLGQPAAGALWELALRPALGVTCLSAAAAFLLAGQSPAWPVLALARSETFPLSLQLAVFQARFAEDPAGLAAAAWLVASLWGLGMLLVWWPLQVLVLEGCNLVTAADPELEAC